MILDTIQVTLSHQDLKRRCDAADTAYRIHLVNCLCLKSLRLAKDKRKPLSDVVDKIPKDLSNWETYATVQKTFIQTREINMFLHENPDIRLLTIPARQIEDMNRLHSIHGEITQVDEALKKEFTPSEVAAAKPIVCEAHERWRKAILGIK